MLFGEQSDRGSVFSFKLWRTQSRPVLLGLQCIS